MNPFTAVENGFPFSNDDLPPVPIVIDLPFGFHWKVTEANGGECGGMCAASLDYFFAGRKPPENLGTTNAPWPDRVLLNYLWQRQLDSLDIRLLPNGLPDLFHWPTVAVKFGERMAGPQRVGAGFLDLIDLINGKPCILGLVYRRSLSPAALTECHQVVAYDIAGSQILVYDPDFPGEAWALAWSGEAWQEIKVGSPLADPYPVHSFFVIPYSRKEPPA